jgi:hypothetical protein
MHVIDHRILVPTPPEIVWRFLSDLRRNPEWQVNCSSVSMLTLPQQPPGVGTRWRATSDAGRDYIAEITAWYDRLGYEYTFVDGAPYRYSKGQIRLQDTPEGTVVQWTFQYEVGGMLGSLKNSLGKRRAIENDMIESLRSLWKVITQSAPVDKDYTPKSLMRDAPDVNARQAYKPRHPTPFDQPPGGPTPTPAEEMPRVPDLLANMPPVEDDDTRPRPAVREEPAAVAPTPEPDAIFRPPQRDPLDVEPEFAGAGTVKTPTPAAAIPPVTFTETPRESVKTPTPAEAIPPVTITEAPRELLKTPTPAEAIPPVTITETPRESLKTPTPAAAIPPVTARDTASISVFDLFGIPKPSETQEARQITVETPPAPAAEPVAVPAPAVTPDTGRQPAVVQTVRRVDQPAAPFGRTGMRLRIRHRRIHVRRPK